MSARRFRLAIFHSFALALVFAGAGQAHAYCGPPLERNNFGRPIDYTDPADKDYVVNWVEQYHWTPGVENLTKGKSDDVIGDLSFILRQIPNHHRALNSMMRWQLANTLPRDAETRGIWTISCYFDRALAFRPNDPTLYLLQGIYFHKAKSYDDSFRAYKRAEALDPNMADIPYNLGLLDIDRKNYDDAKKYAQRAYTLGHPMPGLRNKLKRLGYW